MARFWTGRQRFEFLIAGLLTACGASGSGDRGGFVPGEFIPVIEWQVGDRAMRLGRHEGWRYLCRRFPQLNVPKNAAWTLSPVAVSRRDALAGTDWWFRFEAPAGGPWYELVVLAAGGIEDLDAGPSR